MKLEGIIPAVASPCDEHDIFLEDTFTRLIDTLYREEIRGLYVCGNTGDGCKMRLEERKRAVEIAIDRSRTHGGMVVVHVGSATNTREAVELAEHAAAAGAAAISSLPPARCNQAQLVQYYTDIARESQLPTLVYHIPIITGLDLTVDELTELLDIEGVVGLKLSDYDLYLMERLASGPHRAFIYNGNDQVFAAGLLMGARGGIGSFYNVMPGHFVGIHEAMGRSDLETARRLQSEVNCVIQIGLGYGGQAGMREILRLQGIDCGPLAPPTELVDAEGSARLRAELDASGVPILE